MNQNGNAPHELTLGYCYAQLARPDEKPYVRPEAMLKRIETVAGESRKDQPLEARFVREVFGRNEGKTRLLAAVAAWRRLKWREKGAVVILAPNGHEARIITDEMKRLPRPLAKTPLIINPEKGHELAGLRVEHITVIADNAERIPWFKLIALSTITTFTSNPDPLFVMAYSADGFVIPSSLARMMMRDGGQDLYSTRSQIDSGPDPCMASGFTPNGSLFCDLNKGHDGLHEGDACARVAWRTPEECAQPKQEKIDFGA